VKSSRRENNLKSRALNQGKLLKMPQRGDKGGLVAGSWLLVSGCWELLAGYWYLEKAARVL